MADLQRPHRYTTYLDDTEARQLEADAAAAGLSIAAYIRLRIKVDQSALAKHS